MKRSAAARSAARTRWKSLPAHLRALLLSHRPTDLEQEERLRHSVMTALSNVFGPRTFGADVARQEEPDTEYESAIEPLYACTLQEVAEELGLSAAMVGKIEKRALRNAKAAFEKMEKDRERAVVLAWLTGLAFAEALLLIEANADGVVWAAIDEPRRVNQEKRTEAKRREAELIRQKEKEEREEAKKNRTSSPHVPSYVLPYVSPSYVWPYPYPPYAPPVPLSSIQPPQLGHVPYVPQVLLRRQGQWVGPHGVGCTCVPPVVGPHGVGCTCAPSKRGV